MKKLHLFMFALLLSITGQCFGEWKYSGATDTDRFYIDYSRIKTEGRYKSIWYLADLKTPQTNSAGKTYKSEVVKILVDCQASRTQEVSFLIYSEQMGSGKVIDSGNSPIKESEWGYETPNSIGGGFVKAACGRK
jgi:hypothetical protein